MPATGPQQRQSGAFSDAADRIRDSAKWLLAAFAGVGAVLAAGLPLANLGKLAGEHNDHRLQWAIVAVVIAELGIGIAIGAAASVVTRSFVSLKWLNDKPSRRKGLDGDDILLAGHDSVSELYHETSCALKERRQAIVKWRIAPTDENLSIVVQKTDAVDYYNEIVMNVVQQASYQRLSRGYAWARAFMLFGAAVAASGITLFAWASHPVG